MGGALGLTYRGLCRTPCILCQTLCVLGQTPRSVSDTLKSCVIYAHLVSTSVPDTSHLVWHMTLGMVSPVPDMEFWVRHIRVCLSLSLASDTKPCGGHLGFCVRHTRFCVRCNILHQIYQLLCQTFQVLCQTYNSVSDTSGAESSIV